MSKKSKSKSNKKPAEVMLAVPNKKGKSAKIIDNTKVDKNGKKVAARKSGKLSKGKLIAIIVAVILMLAAIGGGIFWAIQSSRNNDDAAVVDEPKEEPEPEPLENKDPLTPEPDGDINPDDYHVAAYKPRFLSIPSLGLNKIPVTEVGWVNGNQLGSPVSTRVAGWFYRSAIPGEKGPAIINAHGGDLGTGIFKTLPQIKDGDEIIIEMGDGRKFTYVVGEIAFTALGAEANQYMNTAFKSLVPGVPSLTLITCTGKWLPDLQTYNQRLYVRASMK